MENDHLKKVTISKSGQRRGMQIVRVCFGNSSAMSYEEKKKTTHMLLKFMNLYRLLIREERYIIHKAEL